LPFRLLAVINRYLNSNSFFVSLYVQPANDKSKFHSTYLSHFIPGLKCYDSVYQKLCATYPLTKYVLGSELHLRFRTGSRGQCDREKRVRAERFNTTKDILQQLKTAKIYLRGGTVRDGLRLDVWPEGENWSRSQRKRIGS
jgi:hypothetical protein